MELISIIGSGRSGSTFLEAMLHANTKVIAVGEVCQLWGKAWLRDELCGCGKPFSQCEFWEQVVRDAFGNVRRADAERFDALFRRARGSLLDPAMLLGRDRPVDPAFLDVADALYASMWRMGGKLPLLDSSKSPAFVGAVGQLKDSRQWLIHMFRDARGNVHSYRTGKRRPQARSSEFEYIGKSKSLMHAIGRWKLWNRQARNYVQRHPQAATIMYELLCVHQEQVVDRLAQMIGLAAGGTRREWHSVSGNPMRFDPDLRVRPDARWRAEMKALDRVITRLLTVAQQRQLEGAATAWLDALGPLPPLRVSPQMSEQKL